jgi:WW domain
MLKTPGAPSKSSKRGSQLFKNLRGGTAPNTPDDDIDGVKVMANEYDPSQDLEALAAGNIPSSPMRGDANSTNTPAYSTARRSSPAEEEKKESEEVHTATAAGVDVVNKTLALFDDLCAVPQKPATNPPPSNTTRTEASSKHRKKEEFRLPVWGQEPSLDEDDTATNPSLLSESSEPYSSAYTSSTSMMYKENKKAGRIIPKSPTQDHENFEVVLDPTSLQSDDEDDDQESTRVPTSSGTKQRLWPFKGNKEKGSSQKATKNTAKEAVAAAVPPPIAEEEMTEATPDPLIPDVNLEIADEQPEDETPVLEEEPKEITVEEAAATGKMVEPKKSIVKRSWKSCKKLIAKAGVVAAVTKETKFQQHRAEVDSEGQHARSLELQQGRLAIQTHKPDDEMQNGNESKSGEVEEEKNPESSEDNVPQILPSTTDVWNSIVASIAGTFDPEAATATTDAPVDGTKDADEQKAVEEDQELHESEAHAVADEAKARSEADRKAKSKHHRNASGGWNRLKSIKKSAKKLVIPPKMEAPSKPVSTPSKTVATKSLASVSATQKPVATQRPSPTAAVPVVEAPTPKLLEKPKGLWKAVKDKQSSKIYYYHRTTRETTWTKPKEYEQYEKDLKKWKAAMALQKAGQADTTSEKKKASRSQVEDAKKQILDSDRPSSPRVASWPSANPNPKSDDDNNAKENGDFRRVLTPPARPDNTVVLTIADPMAKLKKPKAGEEADTSSDNKNWEKRNEVERLLKSLPADESRHSLDKLMNDYAGKEEVLLKELRAKVEALPFDETQPFDEPLSMEARKRSLLSNPPRSPHRLNQRTMTYMSKASATTRSSALTDRTEKIKNTGKGKMSPFVPISETLSSATSISTRNEDDHCLAGAAVTPAARIPSRVPVPRERQLMVEELTDSRISAESYEGNGGKRGRIVRGRERAPVPSHHLDTVYDGDNDTEEDNTTYDNDTYGTDSVSALSENDTDFLHRKDNFEQARRRALDDAIEREDWDLAAALSEGMRAANLPGGYARAHSSWNQSELDKFIANNDWSAVKNYIARMREKSQALANKSIGAKSQLQHKELMSESSWTSDSASSYESYDSESEV